MSRTAMRTTRTARAHMKVCNRMPSSGPIAVPSTPYARGYITLDEVVEKVARIAKAPTTDVWPEGGGSDGGWTRGGGGANGVDSSGLLLDEELPKGHILAALGPLNEEKDRHLK